ncbi:MAG: hypothetical protein ACRD50_07705 [Candidatus Acidiferrales bacterium]
MKKREGIFLPAAFLVLGFYCTALPQITPKQNTPKEVSQPHPAGSPIAVATQRISRNRQTIEISQGRQSVPLGYCTEMLIVTMTGERAHPEKLFGETVAVARQSNQQDRWNVFMGGVAGTGGIKAYPMSSAALVDNVFQVKNVLSSTTRNPVDLKIDGQIHRLRPGQLLLLLR